MGEDPSAQNKIMPFANMSSNGQRPGSDSKSEGSTERLRRGLGDYCGIWPCSAKPARTLALT